MAAAVAGYHETLRDPASLTELLAKDMAALRSITFDRNFGIRDKHILALLKAVGPQLTSLQLGCSDTGDGAHLTDAATAAVSQYCSPDLRVLRLESVPGMGPKAFGSIAKALSGLEELHFTGHDRSQCNVKDKDLEALKKDPGLLPNLKSLHLTDSGVGGTKVRQLCGKRPMLTVHYGDTDSDSFAGGMVRGMMGADWGDGLFVERGKQAEAEHMRACGVRGGAAKRRRQWY